MKVLTYLVILAHETFVYKDCSRCKNSYKGQKLIIKGYSYISVQENQAVFNRFVTRNKNDTTLRLVILFI